METKPKSLSRRDFLKVSGTASLALAINPGGLRSPDTKEVSWPSLSIESLPKQTREILELTPRLEINEEGYLLAEDESGNFGKVPQAQTQWNKEHQNPYYLLNQNVPWGIVLHWNGDEDGVYKDLEAYLRGFDGLRNINGQMTRTSVQFLVGENKPVIENDNLGQPVSIAQIQNPSENGTPYSGVHAGLGEIDYQRHEDRKQYFVRALYGLGFGIDKDPVILQELFDGSLRVNPNSRTIGIEIAGIHFDQEGHEPKPQKIANTISTVCAIIKRYDIKAVDVLGHYEIQLNKADPGKRFMNQMRMLIGLKALVDNDNKLKELTFGPFMKEEQVDQTEAVKGYFDFVRNYTALTAGPRKTFEWESAVNYWNVYETLFSNENALPVAYEFIKPVKGKFRLGNTYLVPENHEGVDFNTGEPGVINGDLGTPIYAVADGECIYKGNTHSGLGNTVAIKHRLPEGAEVISIYGHLHEAANDIKVGDIVKMEDEIGKMGASGNQLDSHLHFSIAYGAMEERVSQKPFTPGNAGPTWIRERYVDPLSFIEEREKDLEEEPLELRFDKYRNLIQ